MAKHIEINHGFIKPQAIKQAINIIKTGGIAILPSDSGYSLVCQLGDKAASLKIRQIRNLEKSHPFTLLCSDLTHLSQYAQVDNVQFRILKQLFPGAFTCILPATKEVPRIVQHEKRKTIGIRIPDDKIIQTLIQENQQALMGISLFDSDNYTANLYDLNPAIANSVDLIVDVGEKALQPSTILDLTEMPPAVLRQGAGDVSPYL